MKIVEFVPRPEEADDEVPLGSAIQVLQEGVIDAFVLAKPEAPVVTMIGVLEVLKSNLIARLP